MEYLLKFFNEDGSMDSMLVEIQKENDILEKIRSILLTFNDINEEDVTKDTLEQNSEYIFWGSREIYVYELDELLDYSTL